MQPTPSQTPAPGDAHHPANLRLIGLLLCLWFLVSFGVAFFARELDFEFMGWPFSFWMGAQGSLVTFVLITAVYARIMNRRDRGADATEGPDPSV
jgi:putative solute:sodium symporter small subunit